MACSEQQQAAKGSSNQRRDGSVSTYIYHAFWLLHQLLQWEAYQHPDKFLTHQHKYGRPDNTPILAIYKLG